MGGWGPSARASIRRQGCLKSWPSSGPVLLWETTDIGTGYSSVTSTDDAVYITGRRGVNDVLSAFSQDGRKKWEVIYGRASDSNYPDSRGTATVSNDRIFLVSGMGDLVCISKEGKIHMVCKLFKEI